MDKGSELINNFLVTSACEYDSQELEPLIEKADATQPLYGDSGYVGQETIIEECGISSEVHEKETIGNPLTEKPKAMNRKKSQSRA